MLKVKICGLSTAETVRAALEGGAAFLGFMAYPASPRNIDPRAAARLAEPARGRAAIVAVAVDPSDALIDTLARELRPDLIQLHGAESPTRAAEIGRLAGCGVVKAISVEGAEDVERARAYEPVVSHLMFDAKVPSGLGRPGGGGARFDPALLAGQRFSRSWFLAGGLTPWTLAEAVAASRAPMVDVSSGVERGPGRKDPALITAFLDAARGI